MYLEPFHNKLVHRDDFLKAEMSMVANVTCFVCTSIIFFDCAYISDVMIEGSVDILKFSKVDSFKSFIVFQV